MKLKLLIVIIFINTVSYSQQIGNGYTTNLSDFTSSLLSGAYGGSNAVGRTPDNSHDWQHLFVLRHANPENNFQLQLSSSYKENDKLFFRKIENSFNPVWYELATRGTNNFTGNQNIYGNLVIGNTPISNSKFEVTGGGITTSLSNLNNTLTQLINTANPAVSIGIGYLNSDMPFIQSFNNVSVTSNSLNLNPFGGNVGIGTTNPNSKLTVAGNIASREVKVTVDAGADFVFEKDYKLPTLEFVDQFIKENKHLPEIASAKEMQKDGINLSEMNIKLLQKIEEMTLYIIEIKKQNDEIKKENRLLKTHQILLEERIQKIEK